MYPEPHSGHHQAFRNANVTNLTAFGAALQKHCRSAKLRRLLPDYGFMDGGCLSLALAVQRLLGKSRCRVVYVVAGGVPQHAVAELTLDGEPVYLDADGLASRADLVHKMRAVECVPAAESRLYEVPRAVARRHGITDGPHLSDRLAPALAPLFATYPLGPAWLSPTTNTQPHAR